MPFSERITAAITLAILGRVSLAVLDVACEEILSPLGCMTFHICISNMS